MAGKTDRTKLQFLFKKLLGKANTSNLKLDVEETLGSAVQLSTDLILADSVPSAPSMETSDLGTIQGYSAEYLILTATVVPGSTYNAEDTGGGGDADGQGSGPHSYYFSLNTYYEGISPNPKKGFGNFTNGMSLSASNGALQLISPTYSQESPNPYQVKLFEDDGSGGIGDEIFPLDETDWLVDYYNGILFMQDYDGEKIPAFAKAFLYVGDFGDAYTNPIKVSGSLSASGVDVNRYLILSGGGVTSIDESKASDVGFYVSGSIGNKWTGPGASDIEHGGTSVFGGDLFVSGTQYLESDTFARTSLLNLTVHSEFVGPHLTLHHDATSPNDGDLLGGLVFKGNDSAGNIHTYADIVAQTKDVTSIVESGELQLRVSNAGLSTPFAYVSIIGIDDASASGSPRVQIGSKTFGGNNCDFIVATQNHSHALHVDSDAGTVGIGSSSAPGNDIFFYVTGSIGGKEHPLSWGKTVTVFAGDTVISGTLWGSSSLNQTDLSVLRVGHTQLLSGALFLKDVTAPTPQTTGEAVLYSDGGTLYFKNAGASAQQVGSGGGGWTDDGTIVRLETATDRVGIGTTSPHGEVEIANTAGETTLVINCDNEYSGSLAFTEDTGATISALVFDAGNQGGAGTGGNLVLVHSGVGNTERDIYIGKYQLTVNDWKENYFDTYSNNLVLDKALEIHFTTDESGAYIKPSSAGSALLINTVGELDFKSELGISLDADSDIYLDAGDTGKTYLRIYEGAAQREAITIQTDSGQAEVVVNGATRDIDFKVGTDLYSKAFVVDAGENVVYVNKDSGTATTDFRVGGPTGNATVFFVDTSEQRVAINARNNGGDPHFPQAELQVGQGVDNKEATILLNSDADISGSIAFGQNISGGGATMAALVLENDESFVLVNSGSDKDIIFKITDGGVERTLLKLDGDQGRIRVGDDSSTGNIALQFGGSTDYISGSVTPSHGLGLAIKGESVWISGTLGTYFGKRVGNGSHDDLGLDISFFVSGSKASKSNRGFFADGAPDRGTAVFGGSLITSGTLVALRSDNGAHAAIKIDKDYTGTDDVGSFMGMGDDASGLLVDYDVTGVVAFGETQYHDAIAVNYNQDAPTHVGTVNATGADIRMTGGTDGTQTLKGVAVKLLGGTATTGVDVWVPDAATSFVARSGGVYGDLFKISVTTNGATTLSTTDTGGTDADLALSADGGVNLDAASSLIKFKEAGSHFATIAKDGPDNYLNFGSAHGDSSYGIKDDAGTLKWKDDGGSWATFGSGGGGGGSGEGWVYRTDQTIEGSSKSNVLLTSASVAFTGQYAPLTVDPFDVGADVYFFVTGSRGSKLENTDQPSELGKALTGSVLLAGDLVTSGNTYFGLSGDIKDQPFRDAGFFVSGSAGSRFNTTLTGSAVFGGDVIISGSVYASDTLTLTSLHANDEISTHKVGSVTVELNGGVSPTAETVDTYTVSDSMAVKYFMSLTPLTGAGISNGDRATIEILISNDGAGSSTNAPVFAENRAHVDYNASNAKAGYLDAVYLPLVITQDSGGICTVAIKGSAYWLSGTGAAGSTNNLKVRFERTIIRT